MSYSTGAFGATYKISTPWGSSAINIPIEDIARNASERALQAAWPPLESRLREALPSFVDAALAEAIPAFEAEIPYLMDQASQEVQPELRKEIDRALKIGTERTVGVATGISIVMMATGFLLWRKIGKR